ncbi:MAG TPA: PKD domain-containing protein, partial [Burkholderiales bacterium]|nr:PKD domain-containing protein [Burkholderiales bacterium]
MSNKNTLAQKFCLLSLLAGLLLVPLSASAITCDVDGDGDIDKSDISLILAARGKPASVGDVRDANGDGLIAVDDSRACTLRCSRPGCAMPVPNRAPVADAGPDQDVTVGAMVTLNGASSNDPDSDPLTYLWSVISKPAGSLVALSNAIVVSPTLTIDKPGRYEFRLLVNDGKVVSVADSVIVSTLNVAPIANAGTDQAVALGAQVFLNGSASSDADGDSLSFLWQFQVRPTGSSAALTNATSSASDFNADVAGSYQIQLTVSDGALSASDSVIVATTNTRPVANAGPDQSIQTGQSTVLDGSQSSDADGNALAYFWNIQSKPAGSAASLSDPSAVNPSFVADKFGTYVVQLMVNDALLSS